MTEDSGPEDSHAGEPPDPTRYGVAAALGLVGLGLVLRLRRFSEYWLNPDEGIYYSTLTWTEFSDFWVEVTANAHPPAFYLLIRALATLTWDYVTLRGAVLLFGVAAIWGFWLVGRELGGRGRAGVVSGLVAAGLLAVNGEAIALSQVIRPYMLLLALLSGALYFLLRYRTHPTDRTLVGYVTFVCAALLTHYSAVLALGAFVAVVGTYYLVDAVDRRRWERLAVAQAIPATVFAALFLQHLDAAITSQAMADALEPGGWLSEWLVGTPADAWHSFVTFQIFNLPPDFQARSALLLVATVGVSLASRDRLVAVLVSSAVTIALVASAVGLYPFGPSRHDTWLALFTLPALGWLAGHLMERGRRAALAGAGVLAALLAFGGPVERGLGAYSFRTNASEERVIRARDLAALVVRQLDPEGQPEVILMSFQTYNLLMPLYASQRQSLAPSSRPDLFSFPYGSRSVVVAGQWDWEGLDQVRDVIDALPGRLPEVVRRSPERVLLLAGGWGSSVFESLEELDRAGAVADVTGVLGQDPLGRPLLRLIGLVLDVQALESVQ